MDDAGLILARLDDLAKMIAGKHISMWLTTAEAAVFLRCSVTQVERLTRAGLLPFHRLNSTAGRSPRLFHRRHLTAYLVAGKNPVKHRLSPEEKRQVAELLA